MNETEQERKKDFSTIVLTLAFSNIIVIRKRMPIHSFDCLFYTLNTGRLPAGQPYMCCANNHEGRLSVHWTDHRYNMKTGRIVYSFPHSGICDAFLSTMKSVGFCSMSRTA